MQPPSESGRYRVYDTPLQLANLTDVVASERRIWLDTEVADWDTPNPRLSLVQLRLRDGSVHIVDVLAPEMVNAYHATLEPRVIAAPHIEKWAHYARFERRILGPDVVTGLHCTFELARTIPYYRLPLRSLRLASLVGHLFGRAIDKKLQKADWGRRPLSRQELDYAADDPEWCYRVHDRLTGLVRSWDPAVEDPDAIRSRYVELIPAVRDARQRRASIWDAVKAFMISGEREQFADFILQMRVVHTVPIRTLAAAVAEVDPIGAVEFGIGIPKALLGSLRPGGEAAVRAAGHETVIARFTGPSAPRTASKPTYEVDAHDPVGLGSDFEVADHEHRVLESERLELRTRMREWMTYSAVSDWGGFKLSDTARRLSVELLRFPNLFEKGEKYCLINAHSTNV